MWSLALQANKLVGEKAKNEGRLGTSMKQTTRIKGNEMVWHGTDADMAVEVWEERYRWHGALAA